MSRNIGKFSISDCYYASDLSGIFAGMKVIAQQKNMFDMREDFIGKHASFRDLAPDEVVPWYDAIFTAGNPLPTWKERT